MNKIQNYTVLFAKIALFIIFVWFGALKLVGLSPAESVVEALLGVTIPFFPFSQFILVLGAFEILIGVMFLIPKWEKIAGIILILHMFTTFLPLVLVRDLVWQMPLVPTLEGQYIIKNLIIIALAAGVVFGMNSSKSQPA